MMNPAILDPFVESSVEAFESALAECSATPIDPFLPSEDHEKYLTVAAELVRVDLDLAWSRGERRMLSEFQLRFPALFADDTIREQLAFEEFRLRRLAGDDVSLDEYQSRMGVDTDSWSTWSGYDETDYDAAANNSQASGSHGSTEKHNGSTTADLPSIPPDGKLASGTRWCGFEIVRSLGQGSFGHTYLATQEALANRDVVLKFSRFESDEGLRLARLQHTNITPVFSVHRLPAGSVICMPYVGAMTLADLAVRRRESTDVPRTGQFILTCP